MPRRGGSETPRPCSPPFLSQRGFSAEKDPRDSANRRVKKESARLGGMDGRKSETISLGPLLIRVPAEIEILSVIIQVFERPVGPDHSLMGIPVIHDEEFPPQEKTTEIMYLRSV